jgi:hypothetical protein
MPETPRELVILGITESGKTFRPSDWAERLCGVMALFDPQQRIGFSPYVRPILSNGVKCVLIDTRLERLQPAALDFLLGFARDNELRLRHGREEPREKHVAVGGLAIDAPENAEGRDR